MVEKFADEHIVTYCKAMPDLTSRKASASRSRLRFRSSTRTLSFKVSHQRPAEWAPSSKEGDDDPGDGRAGKKSGKRR